LKNILSYDYLFKEIKIILIVIKTDDLLLLREKYDENN
tara:strand:- start:44468 stop:44581 length:114 start_codon:yes stop_codon:yes gene_type:complete